MVYLHFPAISIMLPLLVSLAMALISNEKVSRAVSLGVQVLTGIMSFWLLSVLVADPSKTFVYSMGKFPAPWGNELRAGPFEAFMSSAFSVVMFFSILGGAGDVSQDIKKGKAHYFYLMINLIGTSLMALVYTNDLFTGFVFLELNALAACGMVIAKESGETYKSAIKYLMLSVLGSGLFLMSTALLYGITGHLLMEPAHQAILRLVATGQYQLPLTVTMIMYAVSLAVKCALFPFHTWLPDAHGYSTTTASAVLSGLVLKGFVVMLLKLMFRVYGVTVVNSLGVMTALFALGMISMVAGSVIALMQKDIKRMIAYSTVVHIGYIYLGIGLDNSAGFAAASFHVIAHAFTKGMLFIAAGALVNAAGTKNISEMAGAARKDKIAGLAFLVGAMSLIGVPGFAGFASKFFLAGAIMQGDSVRWMGVIVLAVSTFLNALYYLPAVFKFYSKPGKDAEAAAVSKMPLSTAITLCCMIVFVIGLGIFWNPLMEILLRGFAWLG